MSNAEETTAVQTAQTDLNVQADEVSGRPSEGENISIQDRLPEKQTTLSCADEYAEIRLPEGLKECEENFASFKKLAAELKLPAETAQKLVEWEASAAAAGRKNADGQRAEILQRWTEQTKAAFGPSYQKEIARALAAADRFGGPELRALLDATGLGSHPTVVKTFHAISQQISEDISAAGRFAAHADKTFAEALYGKVR